MIRSFEPVQTQGAGSPHVLEGFLAEAVELLGCSHEVGCAAVAATLSFFSERLPTADFADLLVFLGPLPENEPAAEPCAPPLASPLLARVLDGMVLRIDDPGRPTLQLLLALRRSGLPRQAVAPFALLLWRTLEQRLPPALLDSLHRHGAHLVALVRDAEGMLGGDAISPRLL